MSLIFILLTEIVCRVFIYARTPDGILFDKEVIYKGKPNGRFLGVELNNIGCVGTNWDKPKVNDEIRILLLGGSTSFSQAYPNAIQSILKSNLPKKEFSVVSCGKPRYTSYINYVYLKNELLEYSPDIIVLYMGINDCIYNTFPWLEDKPDIGYFNWKDFSTSIGFQFFKYYLVDKPIRSNPDFEGADIKSAVIFKENLKNILEITKNGNIMLLMPEFAISYPTTDTLLHEKIMQMENLMKHFWGNIPSTVYGVKKHNQIIKQFTSENDLTFIPTQENLKSNSSHFVDICHLTNEGKYVLGDLIAQQIIQVYSSQE